MEANVKKDEVAEAIGMGQLLKFKTPSGYEFEIREQNGSDDDIISNASQAKQGRNLNNFILAIVVSTDFTTTGRLTYDDVLELKLRDKYAILFMSRIHSLGETVKFEFTWDEEGKEKYEYTENLRRYIWDYSKSIEDFPMDQTHEKYDPERLKPYLEGKKKTVELVLKSGKNVKFNYLNGRSEEYLLKLTDETKTKNSELKARGLELMIEDKWIKVENFKFFSPKDMSELRTLIKHLDPEFNAFTEIIHPITGEQMNYPIIGAADFFFPTEI